MSTSNNIRENIFFLLYYFERDFRLSPKRVNFATKVGSGFSLLYYLRENIFFFQNILREFLGQVSQVQQSLGYEIKRFW